MTMPEGDAAAVAAAAAAAAAASKPWYSGVAGVDSEMVGHWTNRGWHTKSAPEVAVEATKAWKGAEHLVGIPADQVLRVPKDIKDEAGWKAVWTRLGKPAEAKDYDFSGVKFSDGTTLDDGFSNFMREKSFALNLPKDTATALTQEFAKYLDEAEKTETTEKASKLAEQKAMLKKNWGPNEAANLLIAQRTAGAIEAKIGLATGALARSGLEGTIGYARVMDI